jgi:uncharacterized secreted protein with C-terminal beta-propeller domain
MLLVEETRVLGENHRPVASDWQTLSHNIVSSTDCTGRCKSNDHDGLYLHCKMYSGTLYLVINVNVESLYNIII